MSAGSTSKRIWGTHCVHMLRVAQHHMREGQLLTQTQEEMLLIGGFGLFWLGTPGPVPVSYPSPSTFLFSPPPLSFDHRRKYGIYAFVRVLGSLAIDVESDHTSQVIKCVLGLRKSDTYSFSSTRPFPFCSLACGPVVVKATVTDFGGIGCSVQTPDPYFQLC